jgi:hypothetical protein
LLSKLNEELVKVNILVNLQDKTGLPKTILKPSNLHIP